MILAKAKQRAKRKGSKPTQVRLGLQAFPKQLFNTVKYVEIVPVSIVVGFGKYVFSTNGLFDPNITGTGHQPLYFDQLIAIYDHYTVLRSRAKVTSYYSSTSYLHALYVDDDTSGYTSTNGAMETPDGKGALFSPSVEGSKSLSISWDASKAFGPNPQAQDSLQGTSSSNPAEQQYFTLVTYDMASTTGSAYALFEIEYDVVWDELSTIPSS